MINNIYSIGYRCNNDDLLNHMKIRKYSSPFSYMIIDYKTALNFIDTKFNNFLDFKYVNNLDCQYKWCNNNNWKNHLFFSLHFPDNNKSKNISDWDNICVWNHHNLFNEKDRINLRGERLLYNLTNKNNTLLLLCIHKIQNYINNDLKKYIDLDFLINFNNKYKTNLLFIIPLYNFKKDPTIIYDNNNILIIFLESFYEGNGTAFTDTRIKWDDLINLINKKYSFNIEDK